jgi:hypothetical protein
VIAPLALPVLAALLLLTFSDDTSSPIAFLSLACVGGAAVTGLVGGALMIRRRHARRGCALIAAVALEVFVLDVLLVAIAVARWASATNRGTY